MEHGDAVLEGCDAINGVVTGVLERTILSDAGGQGQDASAGIVFDIDAFTQTLASRKFILYCNMLLELHSLEEDLASWCEACAYHEPLIKSRTRSARREAIRKDYDEEIDVCIASEPERFSSVPWLQSGL